MVSGLVRWACPPAGRNAWKVIAVLLLVIPFGLIDDVVVYGKGIIRKLANHEFVGVSDAIDNTGGG